MELPAALGQSAQMTAGMKLDGTPIDVTALLGDSRAASQFRAKVVPILQAGKAANQAEADMVDQWIVYRICQLTSPGNPPTDTVEIRRNKIKSQEILKMTGAISVPPDLHDQANKMFLKNLPPLIGGAQYSMEARYNAMLLLGMLDKTEPDSANQRPAVPLDTAVDPLILAADTATLPEILRVGALMGLARHCDLQMASANRPKIAGEALKLLAAKAPPQGFSTNGFHWARKQALQMVTGLAKSGTDVSSAPMVQAITALIGDDTQPLFLRRDAALAIGFIDPAIIAAGPAKPADVFKAMAGLTATIVNAGKDRFGDGPTDLSKPEDVFPKPNEDNKLQFANSVAYYLNCLAIGLGNRANVTGSRGGLLKAASADPILPNVNTLAKMHVDPLISAMMAPRPDSNRLINDITAARTKFEPFFSSVQGAPNAPAAGNGGVPAGAGGALAAPVAPKN